MTPLRLIVSAPLHQRHADNHYDHPNHLDALQTLTQQQLVPEGCDQRRHTQYGAQFKCRQDLQRVIVEDVGERCIDRRQQQHKGPRLWDKGRSPFDEQCEWKEQQAP